MSTTTAVAIYFLIWWVVLFAVLPWGVRSQHEGGDIVPGTDPGAPTIPNLRWKLVWTTLLPQRVELFDLSKDIAEVNNLAEQNPDKAKELQAWATELAKQAAPPLFLLELVRLGLSHKPEFPDLGGAYD